MTEKNLLKIADDMPDMAKENLEKGFFVSYRSEAYPNKHLMEYPNGKLESISVDLNTGEVRVLEVLREPNEQ